MIYIITAMIAMLPLFLPTIFNYRKYGFPPLMLLVQWIIGVLTGLFILKVILT